MFGVCVLASDVIFSFVHYSCELACLHKCSFSIFEIWSRRFYNNSAKKLGKLGSIDWIVERRNRLGSTVHKSKELLLDRRQKLAGQKNLISSFCSCNLPGKRRPIFGRIQPLVSPFWVKVTEINPVFKFFSQTNIKKTWPPAKFSVWWNKVSSFSFCKLQGIATPRVERNHT